MVKQYMVDAHKQQQIIKEQKRKSTIWRRSRPFRIILWLMVPVVVYVFINLFMEGSHPPYMTEKEIVESAYFLGSLVALFLMSIPIMILYIILHAKAVAHLKKIDETLVLMQDKILNVYSPFYKDNTRLHGIHEGQLLYAEEVEIFYNEIERIERNEYYQMVIIYAPIHFTCYSSYLHRKVKKKGTLTDEKGFRMFFDYYAEFDEFVNEVARRSNKQIVVTSKLAQYKPEAKLA